MSAPSPNSLEMQPLTEWVIRTDSGLDLRDPVELRPLDEVPGYVVEDYRAGYDFLHQHGSQLRFTLRPETKDLNSLFRADLLGQDNDIYATSADLDRQPALEPTPYERVVRACITRDQVPAFSFGRSANNTRSSQLGYNVEQLTKRLLDSLDGTDIESTAGLKRYFTGRQLALGIGIVSLLSIERNRITGAIGKGLAERLSGTLRPHDSVGVRIDLGETMHKLLPPLLVKAGVPVEQIDAGQPDPTRNNSLLGLTVEEIAQTSFLSNEAWHSLYKEATGFPRLTE